MKKYLKPNARVLVQDDCDGNMPALTVNREYKTDSYGILIDDDGDRREILSVEDGFFFDHFKYVD